MRKKIEKFQEDGFGNLPICIAKTQYSFSTDPQLRGAPEGHVFNVRDDTGKGVIFERQVR